MLTTMTWPAIDICGLRAARGHNARFSPPTSRPGPGTMPGLPRKVVTAGLFLVLAALTAAPAVMAETGRDPFVTPTAAENPYRFEEALRQITVRGIVRADRAQRVIVHLAGIEGLAVLKPGDKFALDYMGLVHRFKVGAIRAKSVKFHPLPAPDAAAGQSAADAGAYEVFVR